MSTEAKILKVNILSVSLAALALAGCVKDRPFEPGVGLSLVESNVLPPPVGGVDSEGRRQLLIGPFDRLGISVFRAPDFDRSVDVDGAGNIALPLVGKMPAAGKSPHQLAAEVEGRLRNQYVRDPQVSVEIQKSNAQRITVEGEVERPGVYPIAGEMTLLQSIATASGTTEFSKLEDVVVFRTVDGQRMAALFNVELIRRGMYPDPEVYAGDTIVVGDSPARRRFRDIIEGSTLLTTPIIALINTI